MNERRENAVMEEPNGAAPTYELSAVTRSYGGGATLVRALESLDLTIRSGESVAILGPSGSGKTTLLQLLGALDRPSAGTVRFEGRSLERMGETDLADLRLGAIGFVFQQFNLIPTLTAAENVESGLAPLRRNGSDRRRMAAAQLEAVGLTSRARHLPSQLSGGEQQRVAIGRALARSPRVVLADEPTGNLDTSSGEMVIDLLGSLHRDLEITLILVTHDRWVAERAERVLRLADGRLISDTSAELDRVNTR